MATIAQNLAALQQARTDIAEAIENKGVTLEEGAGFTDFPQAIEDIPSGVDTSNDTVTAATLKSGYTAHNAAGQPITGTMLSQSTTVTAETLADGITAYNAAGELIVGNFKLSSWSQLQSKVRSNDMGSINIKDQFACNKGNELLVWEVIGKNHDTPTDTLKTHSLTLGLHIPLDKAMIYDPPEAFYYCSQTLYAGKYYANFKGNLGIYYFRLTRSVPKGGQLVRTNDRPPKISSYANALSTTPIETVTASNNSGQTGTFLGDVFEEQTNGNLNADYRAGYGYNDYKTSSIRQWLNSDKPVGEWWEPQNIWDRPPDNLNSIPGFMYDLDEDFKAVIDRVKVTTALNDNEYETYDDYFFLLSKTETGGGNEFSAINEGYLYPAYNSSNRSRIKYNKNHVTISYSLRTKTASDIYQHKYIYTSGEICNTMSSSEDYIIIACNVI